MHSLFAARLLSYFSDNKEMRNHSTDRINHFLMDIRAESDAREIINQFSQLGHDLIDAIHIQSSSYHARLIHDVVRYIESHYACSELRLEDVAKAFHINSNQLSRVLSGKRECIFRLSFGSAASTSTKATQRFDYAHLRN